MSDFRPMLSGKAPADLSQLTYPLLASPKLDGIRCIIDEWGNPVSRTLKMIPNDHVRATLHDAPCGFDGELMLRDLTTPFRKVSSAIMSKGGEPDFVYAVFDWWNRAKAFANRLGRVESHVWFDDNPHAMVVPHTYIETFEELCELHAEHQAARYEGTMVRDPGGPYKFGRSTTREGYLLKIKSFVDEEAVVIGVEEQMHNTNEAEVDNLGHTKRSSAKAGKVGKGTMGKLVLQFEDGTQFKCGTGFDDKERGQLWHDYVHHPTTHGPVGRVAKIKHQPDPGGRQPGQKPRIPVFLGWRKD